MFTKEERLFIWKKVYEIIDRLEDGEYICVALRNVVLMLVIIHHFTSKMKNDIHLYETSYWVSPIPSTGCSRVRSPDSFTKQNVFDFTYPTNIFFRVKPYIKDLFYPTVLSETRDYVIRLSETKLEKKNMKLNNIRMFYNIRLV